MTPDEIVSAILDDYLISRSIDDTELENRLVTALQSYGNERAAEMKERCAVAVEQRRMQVLQDPRDPSWTEHFAELQNIIRSLPIDPPAPAPQ